MYRYKGIDGIVWVVDPRSRIPIHACTQCGCYGENTELLSQEHCDGKKEVIDENRKY